MSNIQLDDRVLEEHTDKNNTSLDLKVIDTRESTAIIKIPKNNIQTEKFHIVVKSFIAPIGGNIGYTPCSISGTVAQQRLLGLSRMMDKQLGEDPRNDLKDKKYRLYSSQFFSVRFKNKKLIDVSYPSKLEVDFGLEKAPFGVVFQGTGHISEESKIDLGEPIPNFSWMIEGRPAPQAELAFREVCNMQRPVLIWHRINGSISFENDTLVVKTELQGSNFPSHRVWVNGIERKENRKDQGFLGLLWAPDPKDPIRVQ